MRASRDFAGRRPAEGERLQKVLAHLGLGSRRQIERWIAAGRVTINGRVAELGQRVRPDRDRVAVDGRAVDLNNRLPRVYYLLHKPVGFTTSLADPHAERLVSELVPAELGRLFPVGRLDRDTAGLLLMTNDGELAHRLAHPRFGVEKVYEAWVEGVPGPGHLERLRRGIAIGEGQSGRADRAEVVRVQRGGGDRQGTRSLLRLVLHEGQKREIRRLLAAIGHPVISLTRVAYDGLTLGQLKPGEGRVLTSAEVDRLRRRSAPSAVGRRQAPPAAPLPGRRLPAAPAGKRPGATASGRQGGREGGGRTTQRPAGAGGRQRGRR